MTATPALVEEDTAREQRMKKRDGKSRSIHIYLKPGMSVDDLLLGVWDAAADGARPQDTYRRLLLEGVKRMVENGDMPLSIMKDERVVRHLGALGDLEQRRQQHLVVVAPQGGYAQVLQPLPGMAHAAPTPAPTPAAVPADHSAPSSVPAAKKKPRGLDPNLM